MRVLHIISGVAVLFATFAFGHLLYHFFTHADGDVRNPIFLAGMTLGVIIWIFSLIGGFLLLRHGRSSLSQKL
jgi:hypothetical protein